MKNLTEMTRDELKAHVREKGWDEGNDPIKLNSSTEEIRELCILRAAAVVASAADTMPPPPPPSEDAPAPDEAVAGLAEGSWASPPADQPPSSDDPTTPPDAAPDASSEVMSMVYFALRFGKQSLADLSAMEPDALRELCTSIAEVLTEDEEKLLDDEYEAMKASGRRLTMDDVFALAKELGRDPQLLDAPAQVDAATEPPPVRHFRVERYAKWVSDGVVHQLRAGCFVSTNTHPVPELQAQGVPLVEVESIDDSDQGLGHRFT